MVATHSKKSGISGNFKIREDLREDLRFYKSQMFFLNLEWSLVNPVSIFVQKKMFIYF